MFTGITKTVKKVKNVKKEGSSMFVEIEKPSFSIKPGSSILTNGICLSVTKVLDDSYLTELMKPTIEKTSFGLEFPEWVNLEPSIKAGERMDGHFVLGHIDAIGTIEKIERSDRSMSILISHPKDYALLVVPKGSIAIDGVSLTVADCDKGKILVNLVDYTIGGTNFRYAKEGKKVNIEYDIIGKYLLNLGNKNVRL